MTAAAQGRQLAGLAPAHIVHVTAALLRPGPCAVMATVAGRAQPLTSGQAPFAATHLVSAAWPGFSFLPPSDSSADFHRLLIALCYLALHPDCSDLI